jgi:16S rRNA (guanine527-N7)-methyltransferase
VHRSGFERYEAYLSRPAAEVRADLTRYESLLHRWQRVQNLVSRETLNDVWTRHFADSLQVLPLLTPTDHNFLDLGSGGGFPALPLAIASRGDSNRRFVLVEPNGRKASFLRTVARELELRVDVLAKRADEVDSRETSTPNVVTSRALADLTQLCGWMAPFFGPGTRAILHKGREHVKELEDAATQWQFDVLSTQSETDSGGVLLTLRNLQSRTEV